jgi:hypothetical protein
VSYAQIAERSLKVTKKDDRPVKEVRPVKEDRPVPEREDLTYEEALDESLRETFPASDPIAPGVASRADRPVSTGRDATDWVVQRASEVESEAESEADAKREDAPSR